MKKEIIVGIVAAICASFITWLVTGARDTITQVQLQTIADDIAEQEPFIKVLLAELKEADALKSRTGSDEAPPIVPIPTGAVIAFDRDECPGDGWREFKGAYGRVVRGIDRSGNDIDPAGERISGNFQEDSFGEHSHTRPSAVYDAGGGPNASWVASAKQLGYGHVHPPDTGKKGDKETRSKNVALLYCVKQ